jgi:hypothetical protein
MRTGANAFTDPAEIRGPLYATTGRLACRTSALHRARVSGRHAADVIADLATAAAIPAPAVIADIGCGRSPYVGGNDLICDGCVLLGACAVSLWSRVSRPLSVPAGRCPVR